MITFDEFVLLREQPGQVAQPGQAVAQPGQPVAQPGQPVAQPGQQQPGQQGVQTDPEVEAKPYIDYIMKAIQGGQLSQAGLSYFASAIEKMSAGDVGGAAARQRAGGA